MKMLTEFKPLFSFTRQHTPLLAIETAQTPEQIFNPGAHNAGTHRRFFSDSSLRLSFYPSSRNVSILAKTLFCVKFEWSVTDDRPSQVILPPVRVGSHLLLLCISASLRLRVKYSFALCVSALRASSALGIFSILVVSEVRTIKDNRANVCAFSFGDAVFALIVTRLGFNKCQHRYSSYLTVRIIKRFALFQVKVSLLVQIPQLNLE